MGDIASQWSYDAGSDTLIHDRVQDVEPHLEYNKYLQSVRQTGDWGRHHAHIPMVFLEKWLNEEWARGNVDLRLFSPEFDKLIDRKLRDPDWKFLLTESSQVQGWMGFGS